MRSNFFNAALGLTMMATGVGYAQQYPIDNLNPRDQRAINAFEAPKNNESNFDGLKVRVGGAFALQYQGIEHQTDFVDTRDAAYLKDKGLNRVELYNIGKNFNLATANLDIDVALYDGVAMHLRTFLSSRHHPEPYVKGGFLQIDKLDFIQKDFLKDFMKYARIKVGHDEVNYGDAHFRRSDNAYAITNPFVPNYLMDAYATFVFGEVYYMRDGFIGMVGVNNSRLNQAVTHEGSDPAIYAKLGWDKQINQDLRLRLTGSFYNAANTSRLYMYDGDRAGGRYYFVMENSKATSKDQYKSGRITPDYVNKYTAFMFNPFVKYKGLEFFGTFETTSGRNHAEASRRNWNQYVAELIYRFGKTENFYIGGRFNRVDGKLITEDKVTIDRWNVGAGWFMTKNILVKAEWVDQTYKGYADQSGSLSPDANALFYGGKFNGFTLEAVISF